MSFNSINTLILDHCDCSKDWYKNGFYEFLNKSSIAIIILDDKQITQKLIDVFVEKATQNPNQNYVISTYNFQPAIKFEILPNLIAFIRYCFITIEDDVCIYTSEFGDE